METVSPAPKSEQSGPTSSRWRVWLDRQPLWIAQIIAILITWICVGACVVVFVLMAGGLRG